MVKPTFFGLIKPVRIVMFSLIMKSSFISLLFSASDDLAKNFLREYHRFFPPVAQFAF